MKNILATFMALICLMSNAIAFANDDLCIALTNQGNFPVEFDSIVSPGDAYTINPGNSATLSGDHMVGSCLRRDKNDCAVAILILDGTYQNYEIIDHLPRGSRIIYKDLHQFDVDVNANVRCGS